MSEALTRTRDGEYAHLRRKRAETEGTVELAAVTDVAVDPATVTVECRFDWGGEPLRLAYDLDDDRDVARLERLCETNGLAFEQVGHLDDTLLELRYTGSRWVPAVETGYVEEDGSAVETFRAECRLLVRELAGAPGVVRRGVRRLRDLSLTQTIIGVVLVKKVIIVALLAYLLL